jgi:hypothetical protein
LRVGFAARKQQHQGQISSGRADALPSQSVIPPQVSSNPLAGAKMELSMKEEQAERVAAYRKERTIYRSALIGSYVIIGLLVTLALSQYLRNYFDIEMRPAWYIASWIPIILGVTLLSAYRKMMQRKSMSWKPVRCTILRKTVEYEEAPRIKFGPAIRIYYSYRVENDEYLCDRLSYGDREDEVLRLHHEYEIGGSHICYYNPFDPSEAVLRKG